MSRVDIAPLPTRTGSALAPSAADAHAGPRDLARLVMRRACVMAGAFLALALVLGGLAARGDTQAEIDAALALARAEQLLRELPPDDALARQALRDVGALRHVELEVVDAGGQVVFERRPAAPPPVLRWAMQATGADRLPAAAAPVTWLVPRPGAAPWTARLAASPESEQSEALKNLAGLFGVMLGFSVLTLAVLRWDIRRAFRPLERLLDAIRRIGLDDGHAALALPTMPIRELEGTALALKQLARSLLLAAEARRRLALQVQTLQEDERHHIARDLHDEFGQRLTGLRADVAWLRRTAPDGEAPERDAVLAGMDDRIAEIQLDLRGLLAQLRPLGPGGDAEATSAARLAELLEGIAAGWDRPGDKRLAARASVRWAAGSGSLDTLALPSSVVLALIRLSQEAFTNAARHGRARRAEVEVQIAESAGGEIALTWSARDDGIGLQDLETAWQRGNGLAGMRERIWALDGEFECACTHAPPFPGLFLQARITCRAPALPA